MGFNSILTFETKISCGNGEVRAAGAGVEAGRCQPCWCELFGPYLGEARCGEAGSEGHQQPSGIKLLVCPSVDEGRFVWE